MCAVAAGAGYFKLFKLIIICFQFFSFIFLLLLYTVFFALFSLGNSLPFFPLTNFFPYTWHNIILNGRKHVCLRQSHQSHLSPIIIITISTLNICVFEFCSSTKFFVCPFRGTAEVPDMN